MRKALFILLLASYLAMGQEKPSYQVPTDSAIIKRIKLMNPSTHRLDSLEEAAGEASFKINFRDERQLDSIITSTAESMPLYRWLKGKGMKEFVPIMSESYSTCAGIRIVGAFQDEAQMIYNPKQFDLFDTSKTQTVIGHELAHVKIFYKWQSYPRGYLEINVTDNTGRKSVPLEGAGEELEARYEQIKLQLRRHKNLDMIELLYFNRLYLLLKDTKEYKESKEIRKHLEGRNKEIMLLLNEPEMKGVKNEFYSLTRQNH